MNTSDHFAAFCVTKTGLKPYGVSQAADRASLARIQFVIEVRRPTRDALVHW